MMVMCSTKSFDFDFKVLSKEDLHVFLVEGDLSTELVNGTDYSATGFDSDSGGRVILFVAPLSSQVVSIHRILVPKQSTDLKNQGQFFAETHESAFDFITMLIQQIYNVIGSTSNAVSRVLKLGVGDTDGRGSYRANGNRITGLGKAIDDTDAVRKGEVITLVKPYDDNARASAEAENQSALDAAQSAVNAKFSEGKAAAAADYAKNEADRAEAAADSIDTEVIEGLITGVKNDLASHKTSTDPHPNAGFLTLTKLEEAFGNGFPAKWGVDGTVSGFDPRYFDYNQVWTGSAASIDLRTNFGDGMYLLHGSITTNIYVFQTSGAINLPTKSASSVFHIGNVATTTGQTFIGVYKLVKN